MRRLRPVLPAEARRRGRWQRLLHAHCLQAARPEDLPLYQLRETPRLRAGLHPAHADEFRWLPPTCAYRLVSEGKDLLSWHHLVSGDPQAVHDAGISQSGKMLAEHAVAEEDWEEHLIFRAG